MLEPYDGKLSRTVLRGEEGRKPLALPGAHMKNIKLFVSTVLIFVLLGYWPKIEARRLPSKYQKVSAILDLNLTTN